MDQAAAQALIDPTARNAEVLFPYVNGEDLNTRPDSSGSRWIVNFFDWSEERAQQYPDCFEIIEKSVKPERQRVNDSGAYVLRRPLPQRYWQYADKRPALYKAIGGLSHVVAIAMVSNVVLPVRVPTGQVFSHQIDVFATDDFADLALLSSAPHYWWAITRASTIGIGAGIRYTPTDVFETLPRPTLHGPDAGGR